MSPLERPDRAGPDDGARLAGTLAMPAGWEGTGSVSPAQRDALERWATLHPDISSFRQARGELIRLGLLAPSQARAIARADHSPTPVSPVSPPPPVPPPPPPPMVMVPGLRGEGAGAAKRSPALRLNAAGLGVVLAVVAFLTLVVTIVAITTDVFIAPWRLIGADTEDTLDFTTGVMLLAGGLRMSRRSIPGRQLAIAALASRGALTLISHLGSAQDPTVFLPVLMWLALLLLTIRSRYRAVARRAAAASTPSST